MFLGGPDGLPASRPAGIDALLVFPVVAVVVPVLSMISLSCRPGCPSAAFLSLISRTGLQRYCFFLYFQIFSHFFSCFFPFPERDCKGTAFFFTSKFFRTFFPAFSPQHPAPGRLGRSQAPGPHTVITTGPKKKKIYFLKL